MNNRYKSMIVWLVFFWIVTHFPANSNARSEIGSGSHNTPVILSDPLPLLIKNNNHPYIVESVINIPENAIVIVEKGVVILFKNFAGLKVKGSIIVDGTKDTPVVLTSVNDSLYNKFASFEPAPFDWDGIIIDNGISGSSFKHVTIRYSLFGIKSFSERIYLYECFFHQNGTANLSVNNKKIGIDKSPFSYNWEQNNNNIIDTTLIKQNYSSSNSQLKNPLKSSTNHNNSIHSNLSIDNINNKIGKSDITKSKKNKIVFGAFTIGITLAGTIIGSIETISYRSSKHTFNKINTITEENKNFIKYSSKDWTSAKNKANQHLTYMLSGYGIALIGLSFFSVTFTF